eukprot:156364-Alexandrium_andersonii.AAC.1
MGDASFPIRPELVEAYCQGKSLDRMQKIYDAEAAANVDRCLAGAAARSENSALLGALIDAPSPVAKALVADPGTKKPQFKAQPCCEAQHFGFCQQAHAEMSGTVQVVFKSLVRTLKQSRGGGLFQ